MIPHRRIIVTGGRDYDDYKRIRSVLSEYAHNDLTIVHGAYRGADKLAEFAATCLGLKSEPHPADWSRGGKGGPERNQRMVDAGADLVLAFPGGNGTADCVRRARKAGIPVREIA